MSIQAQPTLPLGSDLPMGDHSMDDVSGRSLTLNSASKANGLLVIFSCNTCPWVARWEDRYTDIAQIAQFNNVGMIAINSNEAYRNRGDGMDEMIRYANKANYNFPYVLDRNHEVADAFGATNTPHVFLFNADRKLIYTGSIDDNANRAEAVTQYFLKDAIEQMVAGEQILKATTKTLGCSIKRNS
ncbi:MAG: redoxin domain-containing protein [Balneolaceae bacterium]|jgi:thioredoxin-related protein|nr:redoxin domain-containing protein [Balneolaceae bacterium]